MSRDTQTKMSKREFIKTKKQEEKSRNRKINDDSSDDNSSYTDDDDIDEMEYRKFLKKMYKLDSKRPSHYNEDEEYDEEYEETVSPKKMQKQKRTKKFTKLEKLQKKRYEDDIDDSPKKKSKKDRKKIVEDNDGSENDDYDGSDDYNESDDDNESHYSTDKRSSKRDKINIILSIGARDDEDIYDEDEEWETCSDEMSTENEDEPISSSESSNDEDDELPKKQLSKKKSSKELLHTEVCEQNDILDKLKELLTKNPNDKTLEKCIDVYEDESNKIKEKKERKIKKEKDRNSRIFRRILHDKNTMNDFEFYDKLDISQQKKIIKELREINKITRVEKPYRLTLLESDIPVIFKASAIKKIGTLRYMDPGSGEYYKIKNWVDTFMRIPFGKFETLPLSISDGVEKCHAFMENAQQTLDNAVYGLNDAKMQIMQMLGQLITNPKAIGSAIAIHGPPGTGKTSLVKEGISKILNRPFAFIALGGATDSSFLEGHGYTYEGSTWGKIVQILIDSKCMNPVIYFDELDKISDTPKGEEIIGILTHLTDTTQNSQFHDKYFAEIDFDLSKCLFIFSYNDESKVNPILKDRMYRIQTKGYNQKQKTVIVNNYLLPRIRDQVKFMKEDIIIPEQSIHYIIENHCNKEDGVRNLKRCLEIIYTKLNLYRLMRPDTNLFQEEMSLKVEFPFTVTKDVVDKLVKKSDNGLNPSLYMLYV